MSEDSIKEGDSPMFENVRRVCAASCAVLVLALCVLAASPEAHHWLHHDADEGDHECAVTLYAHGIVPLIVSSLFETFLLLVFVAFLTADYAHPAIPLPRYTLLPERGPPGADVDRMSQINLSAPRIRRFERVNLLHQTNFLQANEFQNNHTSIPYERSHRTRSSRSFGASHRQFVF